MRLGVLVSQQCFDSVCGDVSAGFGSLPRLVAATPIRRGRGAADLLRNRRGYDRDGRGAREADVATVVPLAPNPYSIIASRDRASTGVPCARYYR